MCPEKNPHRAGAFIAAIILSFAGVCAGNTTTGWKNAGECLALIENGKYDRVADNSKSLLSSDRWDADANACLVMAYYLGNRRQYAFKKLTEIADALPEEYVRKIYGILWDYVPELLAEKEYGDNYTINGGDCLLRNVAALKGSGFLIIGRFFDPVESRVVRHVMGYRCSSRSGSCEDIDLTCHGCRLEEPEAVIVIDNYRVSEIQQIMDNRPVARNVRYIQKILDIENGR